MNTKVVGMLNLPGRHESACRVHDPNYISPCINTMGGGGLEPKIALREREREWNKFVLENSLLESVTDLWDFLTRTLTKLKKSIVIRNCINKPETVS